MRIDFSIVNQRIPLKLSNYGIKSFITAKGVLDISWQLRSYLVIGCENRLSTPWSWKGAWQGSGHMDPSEFLHIPSGMTSPPSVTVGGLVLANAPSASSNHSSRSQHRFWVYQISPSNPRLPKAKNLVCSLNLPPFPHIGKPCPCPRNPYRTSTSGPRFFPRDRKQNPQPRTNSVGKP